MSIKQHKGFKAIAVFLVFAIAQIYIQMSFAAPVSSTPSVSLQAQPFSAVLRTRNNSPVSLNGNSASTGATVLTGALIETPDGVGATIDFGPLGILDLAPNTRVQIEFSCAPGPENPENCELRVTVLAGCAIMKTKKGTHGVFDTNLQGKLAETDKQGAGLLDVCVGPNGATVNQGAAANAGAGAGGGGGAGAGAGAGGGGGLSTAAWLLLLAGGAVLVTVAATQGGGPTTPVNPSPS